MLLDLNILCNCGAEAESNFLLESLAACNEHKRPDLEMYFTVNLAFIDYLEQLNNTLLYLLTETGQMLNSPFQFP